MALLIQQERDMVIVLDMVSLVWSGSGGMIVYTRCTRDWMCSVWVFYLFLVQTFGNVCKNLYHLQRCETVCTKV